MIKPENNQPASGWDKAGFAVSTICLLHCLLVPISIALFPVYVVGALEQEWIHMTFVALAVPITLYAMARGHKRHGSRLPVMLACPGLTFLGLAMLAHDIHWLETGLTGIGAGMVAASHLLNHRFQSRADS